MWGGTVLLYVADPDDYFLSTKCCPELMKYVDISISVDCHIMLVIVLESEWSNDAMFGNGNSVSALWRM